MPFKPWRPLEAEGDPTAAAAYAIAEADAKAAKPSTAGEVSMVPHLCFLRCPPLTCSHPYNDSCVCALDRL